MATASVHVAASLLRVSFRAWVIWPWRWTWPGAGKPPDLLILSPLDLVLLLGQSRFAFLACLLGCCLSAPINILRDTGDIPFHLFPARRAGDEHLLFEFL